MNSYTVSVTIKPGTGLYAVSFVRHHKSHAVQKDAAAIPHAKKWVKKATVTHPFRQKIVIQSGKYQFVRSVKNVDYLLITYKKCS